MTEESHDQFVERISRIKDNLERQIAIDMDCFSRLSGVDGVAEMMKIMGKSSSEVAEMRKKVAVNLRQMYHDTFNFIPYCIREITSQDTSNQ